MACKINWTPKAWHTYKANIKYLKEKWTEREVANFILLVDRKIDHLSQHPRIGSSKNKKYPNLRYTLIHKRVALVYRRHKPLEDEIELLVFWNTYQNPYKLKAN